MRVVHIVCVAASLGPTIASGQRIDSIFDARVPNPAYVREHPTLLLDHGHFNLRTPVGVNLDGVISALATSDGFNVIQNEGRFNPETLSGIRVLVVAMAGGGGTRETASQSAFTENEVATVSTWVESGGALLLVFDHYPNDVAIADLAKRLGVIVGSGIVDDKVHSVTPEGSSGTGFISYTFENGLLRDHPITRGREEMERVHRVVTFGGSSLTAPAQSHDLLALASDAFVVRRAPGDPLPGPIGRSQGAAVVLGRGRIVLLADANMIGAQVVNSRSGRVGTGLAYQGADNRRFLMNALHWLAGLLN